MVQNINKKVNENQYVGSVTDNKGRILEEIYRPVKKTTHPYMRMRKDFNTLRRWVSLSPNAISALPFLFYAISTTLKKDVVLITRQLMLDYSQDIGGKSLQTLYKGVKDLCDAHILERMYPDEQGIRKHMYRVDFTFVADGTYTQTEFMGMKRKVC
jgi:hypothetical protein